jgi:pimeloyl-ACP methyl ester carboxylesterase
MKQVFKSEKAKTALLQSYDNLLARWGLALKERDVDTPWGLTHVIEAGKAGAPDLVLFHGVGDNSAVMWELNAAALAERFHVYAIDSVGGPGKSQPNERFWRDFDYIKWIAATTRALGLTRFSVTGVSNGAVLAYESLVRGVPGVERAICIEGGPIVKTQMGAMAKFLRVFFPEILWPTDKNLKRIIGKLASPHSDFTNKCPEVIDHIILAMRSHNQVAMTMYKYKKYDPELDRNLRSRMLFIAGDLRAGDSSLIKDTLIPGGYRVVVVKDAGHAANQEQAEEINRLIIDFLTQ